MKTALFVLFVFATEGGQQTTITGFKSLRACEVAGERIVQTTYVRYGFNVYAAFSYQCVQVQ